MDEEATGQGRLRSVVATSRVPFHGGAFGEHLLD
jgi:hypothetical protein